MTDVPNISPLDAWFAHRRWAPFAYQREAWAAYQRGESGLVHAPTGMGKSYSVWLGLIAEWFAEEGSGFRVQGSEPDAVERLDDAVGSGGTLVKTKRRGNKSAVAALARRRSAPLRAIWVTPMRALANDLLTTLRGPVEFFGLPWSVEARTGDTSQTIRQRQRERLPTALVTTPESLTLLLSYPEAEEQFRTLRCVVIDEWHELLSTKRGVQTELALARLRRWNPTVCTWGLSATLSNVEQAAEVLMGSVGQSSRIVAGNSIKQIEIETILPDEIERFPWSGHLGVRLLPQVIERIERARTSLVFTNTRSQCEIWFRELLHARPDWAAEIAVHHGSLDRDLRAYVEDRLRAGTLRCVVCTSSLDLGVDFTPVEQVIQIGSPKGIARLLQRAGRSGHQPGAVSKVVCVPTHAFELVEYAAAREAAAHRRLEPREPLAKPLDVLTQHLVTAACAGGFVERELFDEVRTTHAYRDLTKVEWDWAMDFVTRGGALHAYPQFSRITKVGEQYLPTSRAIERLHRMSIGTIASDHMMQVKLMRGTALGTIEESFIARLRPGDRFVFAGRTLEFVRTKEMTAYVRKSKKPTGVVPRWDGGRFPLSTQMADAVRSKFDEARQGEYSGAEMTTVEPVLELQRAWSELPAPNQLLIERSQVREGHQLFMYPFEGRSVNEGLASLLAHRISRDTPCSITITPNDYGFEMLSNIPLDFDESRWRRLFSTDELLDDLLDCLNSTELARRQFRDIARVAGLVIPGYPGAPKSARQLQASSSLIYDVFREYDPQNLLLAQARREVLERQLELSRLSTALVRLASCELLIRFTRRLTPLSFPLWAARIQTTQLSTEKWSARVARMVLQLEKAAGAR
jgi:ATP-dependent helicase Lhr and Lhr-like helicase